MRTQTTSRSSNARCATRSLRWAAAVTTIELGTQPVVVGVDGTEESLRAARWAGGPLDRGVRRVGTVHADDDPF
jgi:hypothetical protein